MRSSTVLLLAGRIEAQVRYSAAIGPAVPIGTTADRINIGYQTAVAMSFAPFRSRNRVRLEGAVAELSDKVVTSVARRITFAAANFVATAVTEPNAPAGYMIAGVGAYHQRAAGKGSDSPGVNVGAGISFAFGAFGAFTEARLHYIGGNTKTKLFPITFGLVF
jgi:hypothetical protein